uniref:Elongator complex protein 4 n=1 Tax=Oryza brachyantha TaxID=4533 RepID=J3MG58_ORYBR
MAAAAGGQTVGRSSFSRAAAPHVAPSSTAAGVKLGPNGAAFVSSGIRDLDRILGGGFLLGSVVMVMEDSDAPHHLLLLRSFMAQGVVHKQPLLFAGPMKEPRLFLGTLPAPVASSKEDGRHRGMEAGTTSDGRASDEALRIAWQYKKYFGEEKTSHAEQRDKQEFSNDFDLRKPLERHLLNAQNIECVSTQEGDTLGVLQDRCSTFLSKLPRKDGGNANAGRIAIQSLCAPQSGYFEKERLGLGLIY